MKNIKTKTIALIFSKPADYFLAALILMTLLTYVYCANTTVRVLTVLEKAKFQMQNLSIEVSEMESKRLALESQISTEQALNAGFVQIENPIFIIKNNKATLSLKID